MSRQQLPRASSLVPALPPTPPSSTSSIPVSDNEAIRENDVVCEKGRGDHERWPGNKLYRHLVSANKETYNDRTPMQRSEVIGTIIDTIKENNGWFVQLSPQTGNWVDICEEKVRKKVSDDLRREVRRRREKRTSTSSFSARLKSINGDETEPNIPLGKPVNDPRVNDVLFGPGARRHPGNKVYWDLMKRNLDCYIISPYGARSTISKRIVDEVKARFGRFLEQDARTSLWYEIDENRAMEKTSHALSNKKYKNRKKSPGADSPKSIGASFRSALAEVPEPERPADNKRTSSTVSVASDSSESSSTNKGSDDGSTDSPNVESPAQAKKPTVSEAVTSITSFDKDDDPSVAVRLLELRLLGREVSTDEVEAGPEVPVASPHHQNASSTVSQERSPIASQLVERRDEDEDVHDERCDASTFVGAPTATYERRDGPYDYHPRDHLSDSDRKHSARDLVIYEDRRSLSREEEEMRQRHESLMNSSRDCREVLGYTDRMYCEPKMMNDSYHRTAALTSPMLTPNNRARPRLPSSESDHVHDAKLFGSKAASSPAISMRRNSWVQGGAYDDDDPAHDFLTYRRLGTERRMSAYAMLSKPTSQWSAGAETMADTSRLWQNGTQTMERRASSGGAPHRWGGNYE